MAKWEDLSFLEGGDIAKANYSDMLSTAADKYGIPDKLPILQRILQAESGGNPNAKSPKGASGLMQLMPGTAKGLGVKNINDPAENIDAGVRYFADQLKTFGSDDLALAAYNAGPGAVKKYGGIPPYKETQKYVSNILSPISGTLGGGFNDPRGDRLHYGGDISAAAGTEFIAPTRLRITNVRDQMSNSPGGMVWGVDPSTGLQFKFHHVLPNVKEGQMVEPGQPLGTLSAISGPHLDMKVFDPQKNQYVDWLAQNNLKRGDAFVRGQSIGGVGNPDTTGMVADASGQVMPQNLQNPQSPEKKQAISEILSNLAQNIGPKEAQAAEPQKNPVWEDLGNWEELNIAPLTPPIQPDLSAGQKVARAVIPYAEIPLKAAGAIGGGVVGSGAGPMGTVAGSTLGYGMAANAINVGKEYAGLKETPQTIQQAAQETGGNLKTGAEMAMMGEIGGKLAEPVMKWFANRAAPALYERVMKISTVPKTLGVDRAKAVSEGLEGQYAPTAKGLEKLQADKQQIIDNIERTISEGARAGKTIPTAKISSSLDELKGYYDNMPDPRPYIEAIDKAKSSILEYRGETIPIDVAQKIKTTLYQTLKKAYGEMKNLDKEFDKSVARGIKEAIEEQVPEIADLNRRLGDKMNLEKVLTRATNRIRNHDLISLTDYIIGGAGGTIGAIAGGSPAGFATALGSAIFKKIITSPTVQTQLSFYMSKLSPQAASNLAKVASFGITQAEESISSKRTSPSLEPSFAH